MPPTYAEVESALFAMESWRADSRAEWIRIGQALHDWDEGPDGMDLWLRWSKTSPKFRPGECEGKWRGFRPAKGVTIHSLMGAATEDGWDPKGGGNGNGHKPEPRRELPPAPPPRQEKAPAYHWRSESEARAAFAALPRVMDAPETLAWLRREYGLDPKAFSIDSWRRIEGVRVRVGQEWRELDGIVYEAHAASGRPAYKFKSFERCVEKPDGSRKRAVTFLHAPPRDDGAAALFWDEEGAPLVIVGGEEKAAAAREAGLAVLSPVTGEGSLPEPWKRHLLETANDHPFVVFAHDSDEAGDSATAKQAADLAASGFPIDRIRIVHWPEGTPSGYDLNDALKEGRDLGRLLAEAEPYRPDPATYGNQALTLREFMSVGRPKLKYLIEGVLPEMGKMTISAVAKGYKTTLLLELGLCAAAGACQYLNFQFHDPVSTLLLQPELSDALLEERLNWIARTAPPWLAMDRAASRFHVLETAHGRPCLWQDHPRGKKSREELEREIRRREARLLLVDSLYMAFAGMDEMESKDMTLALDYLGDLANRTGVAVILTHHFNKAGSTRGSSVFQGWGESDLAITGVEKDPAVVKVDALLRCSFAKGYPAYWRKPDERTAWFELLEGYEPEKPGRRASYQPNVVAVVLQARGSLNYGALKGSVMEATGCSERTSEDLISKALKGGFITQVGKCYMHKKLS